MSMSWRAWWASCRSASSFLTPVTPAIWTTITRTKVPRAPMVSAWGRVRNEGIRPHQRRYWATKMLNSDQAMIGRQAAAPHCWSSSSATKA